MLFLSENGHSQEQMESFKNPDPLTNNFKYEYKEKSQFVIFCLDRNEVVWNHFYNHMLADLK